MSSISKIDIRNEVKRKANFDRVVCWWDQDTRNILDVEATRTSDSVFLATHHPVPMTRMDDLEQDVGTKYSQEQLLEDFLDPREDFRFVPILGETGVGKSHLVRWLSIKTEERSFDEVDRRVLLIEKAGANLREVLRRILNLDVAQSEHFDKYREKLEDAGEDISKDELKERIRFELKIAVDKYDPFGIIDDDDFSDQNEKEDGVEGVTPEHEKYISGILPALIDHPYFRDDWLEEEGVIDRTYKKSFQQSKERESPTFSEEDLPLRKSMTEVQKNAPGAFDVYRKLDKADHLEAALRVLNTCLGKAVQRVLNFKGNDLFELMNDVRREFAKRDVELVLFIEDIAAVQGLDRQLLASIERSEKDLGVLRTAMGCTEKYYNSRLKRTTRERASFRVNLNVEDREDENIDLSTFASRYLNAIRLGEEQLENKMEDAEAVPNACDACPFREPCHKAFGEREGRGLYPFTDSAINTLYEGITDEPFNPRRLLMRVLRYILIQYTDDIKEGAFPSDHLRKQFRYKEKLSVPSVTKEKWQSADPEHAKQRILLADTWGEKDDGSDLSSIVFQAFGLEVDEAELSPLSPDARDTNRGEKQRSRPEEFDEARNEHKNATLEKESDEKTADDTLSGDGAPGQSSPLTKEKRKLRDQEERLGAWTNEATLSQAMVETLRGIVHKAVVRRIDWDAEGLSQSFLTGKARRGFCKTSIDFNGGAMRQDVKPKDRRVKLKLPLDSQTPTDIEIALVGLLRANHHGTWNFPDGNGRDYLLKATQCIDTWANLVLNQLRRPSRNKPTWDPAPAAAELLAVRARLAGVDMSPDVPLEERVNALFRSYEFDTEGRGRAWTRLVEALENNQKSLVDILEAHAWLRKGAKARTRVYDLSQIAPVLSSLDEHNSLQASFRASSKAELRKEYRPLWHPRTAIEKHLEQAIGDEVASLKSWMESVQEAFGSLENITDHVEQVDDAIYGIRDVAENPIIRESEMEHYNYRELADEMRKEEIQDTARSVAECLELWRENDAIGSVLTRVGKDREQELNIVSDYIEAAETLLTKAHKGLRSDVKTLEEGEEGLATTYDEIRSDLDQLETALKSIHELDQ